MRIYRGDLMPSLVITCLDGDDPVDLTIATSVFVIGVRDGVVLFNRAATSATALGVVTMDWVANDTAVTGVIEVEVEVTWPGARAQTFRPPEMVTIAPDLA